MIDCQLCYRPAAMPRWIRAIDALDEWVGRGVSWLTVAMAAIGAFNAIARYLGRFVGVNLSSNVYLELQWYLFSLVFLLGAGWCLGRNAHVRVDVLYARLDERAQAWIDVVGTLVLLVPFTVVGLWVSWPAVRNSWAVREVSSDPGGLVRYPLKAMILVSLALVLLQGIAELGKRVVRLRELAAAGRTRS